jgi:hypothetical protein
MAKLQEALRERKNRRKNRSSGGNSSLLKVESENTEVHNLGHMVSNISTMQCPTPMQTDDDNQINSISDCLTV